VSGLCSPLAEVGDVCVPHSCVKGAFCEAGQCVVQRDSGPCDESDNCSAASYCLNGECQRKQPNGNACTDFEMCQGQCDFPPGGPREPWGGLVEGRPGSEYEPGVCIDAGFAARRSCAGEL